MVKECCATCRYNRELVKFDYSQGGCRHTNMDGFACVMPENEGRAVWMVGSDAENDQCELLGVK